MDENSKRRIRLWFENSRKSILYLVMVLWIAFLAYFSLVHDSTPTYGEQARVRQYLRTINNAQQVYFLDEKSFTDSYTELEVPPFSSKYYRLTIKPQSESVITYAVPEQSYETDRWLFFTRENKNKPLYGYVSGISYLADGSFAKVVCINETLGKYKIQQPNLINNKLVCHWGTKKIK